MTTLKQVKTRLVKKIDKKGKIHIERRRYERASTLIIGADVIKIRGGDICEYAGRVNPDIPLTAEQVKKYRYSAEELDFIEREIYAPARAARAAEKILQEVHANDPNWRVRDAIDRLDVAFSLIEKGACLNDKSAEILRVFAPRLSNVLTQVDGHSLSKSDPLELLLAAVERATDAVRDDFYKTADGSTKRESFPAKMWRALNERMTESPKSLRVEMQEKGFVKTRSSAIKFNKVSRKTTLLANPLSKDVA